MSSPTFGTDAPLAPAAWDALVPTQPLLSHAFLQALHRSGCATEATGWRPCYLSAWEQGILCGALPLYQKTHSYGEYVFDWAWANAYHRHGRHYFPKLVAAMGHLRYEELKLDHLFVTAP